MEMHQIRYFLAVCSERNFTRAARLCHVSQPSLTRAIKLLEAEFGGSLFRREHANSNLTELGEIVRPHLQQVWDQSYAAIAHAQEYASTSRSRLKIGVMSTLAPSLLIDLLARMRNRHQAIEIEIVEGGAHDLEEQLLGGHIAVAVYGKPGQKVDTRFVRVPLLRERMMIAVPRHHRWAKRTAIRLADLAGESLVRRSRCEYGELIGRLLRQHRIDCGIAIDCARDDWALSLIACGLGVGLLPQNSINHPGVVARPLAEPELWREIGLYAPKDRARSEGLDAFMREATRALAVPDAPAAVIK
jgi:LysR family hydrogen peroxide-inducible transcriptional activator